MDCPSCGGVLRCRRTYVAPGCRTAERECLGCRRFYTTVTVLHDGPESAYELAKRFKKEAPRDSRDGKSRGAKAGT